MTAAAPASAARPRLGFLGVGWIGRHRMEALIDSRVAEVVAVADADADVCRSAAELAPGAVSCARLDELLEQPLDGVVVATPSALHAEHSVAAFERGLAVFCQKPLARTADEARRVIAAARRADRPLGVDLSYRHTAATRVIRTLIERGELGRIFAADLVFHNAYGPDKPWFYERRSSGGGCVMDLGVHLLDLALWLLGYPAVRSTRSRMLAAGEVLAPGDQRVEDYAVIELELAGGVIVRVACSWRLAAGRDAVIEAALYGTGGGAAIRNVDGSFYDFIAERYRGTTAERLTSPPDPWGGRAIVEWASKVSAREGFDAGAETLVQVHELIDAVYDGRGAGA